MPPLPVPPTAGLDSPPPSPANPQEGPPGGFGGTGVPGIAPPGPSDAMKQLTTMGMEIDRALVAFSEMLPGDMPEIGQARKLLQSALAKVLAGGGTEPSSPGGVGAQFPGGGMSSGSPF